MARKGCRDVYSDSDDEVDVCEFEQNLSEEEGIFMCNDDGRDAGSDHSKVSFSRVFFLYSSFEWFSSNIFSSNRFHFHTFPTL
jgi:hypothetical protein